MSRRHMIAPLAPMPQPSLALPVRHPTTGDTTALAELMLAAYDGTIDSDGTETFDDALTEVQGYLAGSAGAPLLDHSFVAIFEDRPVAALLVTRHDGMPLIAYTFTSPEHKGRGLATGLMIRAMRSLHAAGEPSLHLYVTRGNVVAEHIYERLGFRDADGPLPT